MLMGGGVRCAAHAGLVVSVSEGTVAAEPAAACLRWASPRAGEVMATSPRRKIPRFDRIG